MFSISTQVTGNEDSGRKGDCAHIASACLPYLMNKEKIYFCCTAFVYDFVTLNYITLGQDFIFILIFGYYDSFAEFTLILEMMCNCYKCSSIFVKFMKIVKGPKNFLE